VNYPFNIPITLFNYSLQWVITLVHDRMMDVGQPDTIITDQYCIEVVDAVLRILIISIFTGQ